MTPDLILFLFLAVVAIASSLAMLLARNPVYSAIYLALNFSAIAVFYLILQAPFIAMAQISVYAGAIMVLFLFVIMLLGGEQLHTPETLRWQAPLAGALGLVLLLEVGYVFFVRQLPGAAQPAAQAALAPDFGSPLHVGEVLFTQYLLPFEVTSILLLIGMVGAIVLTRVEKKKKRGVF